MKKISLILSLVLFMVLGGCLSKKTEEQLSEVPGNNGGTPGVVQGDYVFKSAENINLDILTGSVMEFGYTKATSNYTSTGGNSFELTPTGEVLPYVSIKSIEGTTIDLKAELTALVLSTVPQGIATKKSEGKILFSKKNNGTFEKGEIVKGSENFYYIIAKISLPIIVNKVEKTYSYIVKTVVKKDEATQLATFENIIRSLNVKVVEAKIDLVKQTELIKKIKEYSKVGNYDNEIFKQEIYKAVDDFYSYIEAAYVEPTTKAELKRKKAIEYVIGNSLDYMESSTITYKVPDMFQTITSLLSNVSMAYRDDLQGEIKTAVLDYYKDEKGEIRTISNLENLEKKLDILINSKIKQDSLEKYIYNKEFWKNVVISEFRNDKLVQDAIKYIIFGNLENIRITKIGEGQYPVDGGLHAQYYEEQLKKVTTYASLKFYRQEYFLPKNDEVSRQLNIQDFLLIKGVAYLTDVTVSGFGNELLGKTEFVKGTKYQRTVYDIFVKSCKNVIKRKIDILTLKNTEYFDKIETAEKNGTLSTLDLYTKRILIKDALDDLANVVKIYDSSYAFDATNDLDSLLTKKDYYLTTTIVTDAIKNITKSIETNNPIDVTKKESLNYQRNIFIIPTMVGESYIDLKKLGENVLSDDTDNVRINTGVKTSLDILAKTEKYQ